MINCDSAELPEIGAGAGGIAAVTGWHDSKRGLAGKSVANVTINSARTAYNLDDISSGGRTPRGEATHHSGAANGSYRGVEQPEQTK